MPELRWHPLLGEWVAVATQRQERTFFPPDDYCPLCPSKPGGVPTEVPAPTYDMVVFENKFPSLAPPHGQCEVVLYTPEHDGALADLPVRRIEHLIKVWRDRTRALHAREDVQHVFPFENKGAAIGVTLTHPHGQIYAYPFVPPVVQREIAQAQAYREREGACLFCDVREGERSDGRRIVAEEDGWVAYIPAFARWPYETHLVPTRCVRDLLALDAAEVRGLARLLRRVLAGFDALFGVPFPYIMAVHQGPKDDAPYHLHLEFYPPMRSADKLKFLAGSESGAGMFINDTLAEEKAAELRALAPCHPEPVEG